MYKKGLWAFVILSIFLLPCLGGCLSTSKNQNDIQVVIKADGKSQTVTVPVGSTVQEALTKANLSLGNLDQVDPSASTLLVDGNTIKITRVVEKYEVNDMTIAFDHQTVKNESLSLGQQLLVQAGVNGTEEITNRIVYQDGLETSSEQVKTTIIQQAVPEIVMVGVQEPFASLSIPGYLAYLTAGNAWMMQTSTGNRFPLITSGDLDGRVFSLSADGKWLLFTRKPASSSDGNINSLWLVKVTNPASKPIDLGIKNIVLFAAWVPGKSQTISYSTVEPRSTAPGWQANNDLSLLSFDSSGKILDQKQIIGTNSGGIYGWWGTTFAWSPDGSELAYARPDEVGLVDLASGAFESKIEITPYQTNSEWAWVPPLSWSPDGHSIFTVVHSPDSTQTSAEVSQVFDLTALLVNYGTSVNLVSQSGMFTYPITSPLSTSKTYQIAFLQAVFPDQSQTSHYQVVVMAQDGANQKVLFPQEGSTGVDPQQVVWSPVDSSGGKSDQQIALLYSGNIWFVNLTTGEIHQITGDGLTSKIDWK